MVANLNSLCVDFVVRQKTQGTHLNWYLVEQLPVIAPDDYDRKFGNTTARELVKGGRITDHWGGGKVYHWSRRWSA